MGHTNVAHDNPHDRRFHASVNLGFANTAARGDFFTSSAVETCPVSWCAAGLREPRTTLRSRTSSRATSSPATKRSHMRSQAFCAPLGGLYS
jgi:hypothetical protein